MPEDSPHAEMPAPPEVPEALRVEAASWSRTFCPDCGKGSMFYCPYCCSALGMPEDVKVPSVRLPFRRLEVVFDDKPQKATGIHAKVLAPSQVRLVDLFTRDSSSNRTLVRRGDGEGQGEEAWPETAVVREMPMFDTRTAVVLFPDDGSMPYDEAAAAASSSHSSLGPLAPLEELTVIAIDSPWRRALALRRHPELKDLRSIRLKSPPPSLFWRFHSEGSGCVSTIEAIAALARELSSPQELPRPSLLQADPLLFLFARQYAQIAARSAARGDDSLPMDAQAKDRRACKVVQKERQKRMCPLGDTVADGGVAEEDAKARRCVGSPSKGDS